MNREERTVAIIRAMDRCAERFCERSGGLDVELAVCHKGWGERAQIQYRRAYVFYSSFLLEFKYTVRGTLGVVSSVLECLLHLDKEKEGLAMPLAMALDACGVGTALPLSIPGILSPEGMEDAFELIGGVLQTHMALLSETMGATEQRRRLEAVFYGEISMLYNTAIDESNVEDYNNDGFYSFFTLRFCSSAFINYIKGNEALAIKQLGRVKRKTSYERRVLALWREGGRDAAPFERIRAGLSTYNKSGVAGTSKQETVAMFLSWFGLTVVFSVGYLALFLLLLAMEYVDTVYLMGPIYNIPYCILAGFLTAIPVSYFVRFRMMKWLFPKHYEKFRAADQVNNGPGGDRVIKVLLHVILICSILCTVLFSRWGLRFEEDGFVDNTSFFSVRGAYYDYTEVERVFYRAERVNGFGETLPFPSYVLVLKDGREIDFYEYGEIGEYEDVLLEHLEKKGISVERNEP